MLWFVFFATCGLLFVAIRPNNSSDLGAQSNGSDIRKTVVELLTKRIELDIVPRLEDRSTSQPNGAEFKSKISGIWTLEQVDPLYQKRMSELMSIWKCSECGVLHGGKFIVEEWLSVKAAANSATISLAGHEHRLVNPYNPNVIDTRDQPLNQRGFADTDSRQYDITLEQTSAGWRIKTLDIFNTSGNSG